MFRETALERDLREEQRIECRRQREALRQQNLRGAKNGCGVVDKRSIEAQISAATNRAHEAREEERRYAERTAALSAALAKEEEEEKIAKAAKMLNLREEWENQKSIPRNEIAKIAAPIDLNRCGLAAVQKLDGDCAKEKLKEKNLRQARQTRMWAAEALAKKEAQAKAEEEEERRFAAWEKFVLEQQAQKTAQESRSRAQAKQNLGKEYMQIASARRVQKIEEKRQMHLAEKAEIQRNLTDPMLNENYSLHDDGRVRIDHFRGFTKGQTKSIYADNEIVKQAKTQHLKQLQDEDARLNQQLEAIQTALLQAEYHKDLARKAQLNALKQDLEEQRHFDNQKKIQAKQEQFGSISNGSILHGFGTSYR